MGYYENHVEDYIAFSAENPIRPEHAEFLKRLKPDSLILDVGFGAANDMRHFQKEGMRVCGIDLCEPFVERAKNFGLDVRALSILDLKDEDKYDAVWASASLLHLTKKDLPQALSNIKRAMKDDAIFYCSFKYGDSEREDNGRHYSDFKDGKMLEPYFDIVWQTITDDVHGRSNRWIMFICVKK